MAVLFLKVAMIRASASLVVVRASDFLASLRRPLALMRMVVVRPAAAAPGAETGVTACRLIRARLRALSHRTPDRSAKAARRAGVRVTLRF